jgi:hypothetical protein
LRNFDLLEGAVEVEIKAGELADAEFAVDADAGMDFFAGVTVGFEADVGLKKFDLRRSFRGDGFFSGSSGLSRGLLGVRVQGHECEEEDSQEPQRFQRDERPGHNFSLGREGNAGKLRCVVGCVDCTRELSGLGRVIYTPWRWLHKRSIEPI